MKIWILSIFTLLSSLLFGQILENKNGQAFSNQPFFNSSFIKNNKIKSLKGYYVLKSRNKMMLDTKFEHVYNFNKLGYLESTYETRPGDGTPGINWNKYEYDSLGHLVRHEMTEKNGFKGIEYHYDTLGRITQEIHYRTFDTTNIDAQNILINEESWRYSSSKNGIKRTKYNSYDRPYLDEFKEYNDLGYLVRREELIKMTSKRYTYAYSYDDHGLLGSIEKIQVGIETPLEVLNFRYDEVGNLIEKHLYKNGVFITDFQIIYNSKTKLLSTIITKNVATGHLIILRFKDYDFFNS